MICLVHKDYLLDLSRFIENLDCAEFFFDYEKNASSIALCKNEPPAMMKFIFLRNEPSTNSPGVENLGYKFRGSDPLNSLSTLPYKEQKAVRTKERGVFSLK